MTAFYDRPSGCYCHDPEMHGAMCEVCERLPWCIEGCGEMGDEELNGRCVRCAGAVAGGEA